MTDVHLYYILKFVFACIYILCGCVCFHSQIEDGEIFATINQKDGMVRFHDNPEKYNSAAMLLELDKEVSLSCLSQACACVCMCVCICVCVCVFCLCKVSEGNVFTFVKIDCKSALLITFGVSCHLYLFFSFILRDVFGSNTLRARQVSLTCGLNQLILSRANIGQLHFLHPYPQFSPVP